MHVHFSSETILFLLLLLLRNNFFESDNLLIFLNSILENISSVTVQWFVSVLYMAIWLNFHILKYCCSFRIFYIEIYKFISLLYLFKMYSCLTKKGNLSKITHKKSSFQIWLPCVIFTEALLLYLQFLRNPALMIYSSDLIWTKP